MNKHRPDVLLDANILVPYYLTDLLLWLADEALFQPLWTEQILEEAQRNIPEASKGKVKPEQAGARIAQIRGFFGPASLVTGHEATIPEMTNHRKDRHVLAAAVHAEAAVLVTNNLKDFKPAAVHEASPELQVMDADSFLVSLLESHPESVPVIARRTQTAYKNPPKRWDTYLDQLGLTVPRFVAELRRGSLLDSALPLPIVAVSDEAAANRIPHVDGLPDTTTVLGLAHLWWSSILHEDLELFNHICLRPTDWPPLPEIAKDISGRDLHTGVIEHPKRSDVAYVLFIDGLEDSSGQMFADAPVERFHALTLVSIKSHWYPWGYTEDYLPDLDTVFSNPDQPS